MPSAREVADFLDERLSVAGFPDYPNALNGLQLDHIGPVRKVATAVDFSQRTVNGTIAADANLLVLHHGLFWAGPQRLVGTAYHRLQQLVTHDVAVYAAHLPLDAHLELGNCARLARELGLEPAGRFGEYQGVAVGVRGSTEMPTADLLTRVRTYAAAYGGEARASHTDALGRTHRWAIITGAGADAATLRAAASAGIDTLIVGEGPHHTTVDAPEFGITVIYAGHYATETPGVRALADEIQARFGVPASFLLLPTGS